MKSKPLPPYITRKHARLLVNESANALKTLVSLAEFVRANGRDVASREARADAALDALSSICIGLGLDDLEILTEFIDSFPAEDTSNMGVQ